MVQELSVSPEMGTPGRGVADDRAAWARDVEADRVPGVLGGWSPGRPRRPLDFTRLPGLGCDCDFNRPGGSSYW